MLTTIVRYSARIVIEMTKYTQDREGDSEGSSFFSEELSSGYPMAENAYYNVHDCNMKERLVKQW